MTNPKFKKMSHKQVVELVEKLKTVCSKSEDGTAVYIDGYDDKRVHDEFSMEGKKYSFSSIQATRFDFFGPVRKFSTKNENQLNKINLQLKQLIYVAEQLKMEIEELKKWASNRPVKPYGK
jgi:hypothetical protein